MVKQVQNGILLIINALNGKTTAKYGNYGSVQCLGENTNR